MIRRSPSKSERAGQKEISASKDIVESGELGDQKEKSQHPSILKRPGVKLQIEKSGFFCGPQILRFPNEKMSGKWREGRSKGKPQQNSISKRFGGKLLIGKSDFL